MVYSNGMGFERAATYRYVKRLDEARSTLRAELEDEVAPVRSLSLAEHGRWIAELCASARAILSARSDSVRVLLMVEPPAADYREKWQVLNGRFRAARHNG